MKKAAVLIDNGFQDAEAIYPYYRLQEADFGVDLVGQEANHDYEGEYGYTLTSDRSAKNIELDDYKAIIVPGGHAPDKMRVKEDMVRLIQKADEAENIIIGAICHGPQLLIEADIVNGRDMTSYKAVRTDLINAGANYDDKEVVVDSHLVTSRTPDDLPAFMNAVVDLV